MKFAPLFCAGALALSLSACSPFVVSKVDTGERQVGEGLSLKLESSWNHISSSFLTGPHCQLWTVDGLPMDQLLVYSGLKNEEMLHAASGDEKLKSFKFRADMQPDQVVALFEGMLTRDGSTFTLKKLAPAPFSGAKGFRYEFSLLRKRDNVELSGVGQAIVSKGELYALVYMAPRLMFGGAQQARVNKLLESARLKG